MEVVVGVRGGARCSARLEHCAVPHARGPKGDRGTWDDYYGLEGNKSLACGSLSTIKRTR